MIKKSNAKSDEKGNLTKRITYTPDGRIMCSETYKYDENGNKTEYIITGSDGSENKYTYKYDTAGQLIENVIYGSDGISTEKATYKYDEKGIKIEGEFKSSIFGSNYGHIIYTYDDFDKNGNWTHMTIFNDNSPLRFITKREIKYY